MLCWVEEEQKKKIRTLRFPGVVENKEKKARWLLSLSTNSIPRCIKKTDIQKVTVFDSG